MKIDGNINQSPHSIHYSSRIIEEEFVWNEVLVYQISSDNLNKSLATKPPEIMKVQRISPSMHSLVREGDMKMNLNLHCGILI